MADLDLVRRAWVTVFTELIDGAASDAAWVLNPEDHGLLRSLEMLSAEHASAAPSNGGASIAAQVDHLRYGLGLMNRWSRGEDPFKDADYSASWHRGVVTESEWAARRAALRQEADAWRDALTRPRELTDVETTGIVASIAHLAYHMGAMRQIDRSLRGPAAKD